VKKEWIGKAVLVAVGVLVWCGLMFLAIPRGEIERTVEVLIPPADIPVDSKLLSRYFGDKTQFEPVDFDWYLAKSPQMVGHYWFAQPGSGKSAMVTYLAESREGQCLVASKKYDLPEFGFYAIAAVHLEDGQLTLRTRTDVVEMFKTGVAFAILGGTLLWGLWGWMRSLTRGC